MKSLDGTPGHPLLPRVGNRDLLVLTDAEGHATGWPADSDPFVFIADGEGLRALRQRALAAGTTVSADIEAMPEDGKRRWWLLSITPQTAADGSRQLLHLGIEVSARHAEESRLRHHEALMTDTEGIAHYGVWEWDITQPNAEWSHGLYQIYGETPQSYTPSYEGYLGKVHPEDRQRVMDATNGVFHEHRPYSHDERILHTDGNYRYLHTWAVPILDSEGQLKRLMGVCLDITERKLPEIAVAEHAGELHRLNASLEQRVEERTRELTLAKDAAEHANASKSQFLATMSHEVRTPMNGVLGMLELVLEDGLAAEQRRMLTTVRDSAQSLLEILDDILDFSKIEAGSLELENVPVNLADIVEGVADTFQGSARSKLLRLHCYIDPALPEWIIGDRLRIRQVLMNLVGNAVKFTETNASRNGEIRVAAEAGAAGNGLVEVLLTVSDNGIGMDADTQARLFSPFTQGDISTTRRFGGTGLGLSICKRLAKLMQGDITVDSAPGDGATFRMRLRVAAAEGSRSAAGIRLDGLRVIALVHPGETGRVLTRYLRAARALVELHADLPAFTRTLAACHGDAGNVVVLVGPEHGEADIDNALAQWRSETGVLPGVVLLTASLEVNLPMARPGVVRTPAWPLRRRELLGAVEIAAGRAPGAPAAPVHPRPVVPRADLCILVAEDNPVNQEILRRQLQHLGYACVIAGNGKAALDLSRQQRFDLVLCDCYMPELDGFALTRSLREDEASGRRSPRLPIVAITANAMRGEAERCVQAGMDDYLAKPIQLAQLQRTLQQWLEPSPARP